jgi:hypothetical protein
MKSVIWGLLLIPLAAARLGDEEHLRKLQSAGNNRIPEAYIVKLKDSAPAINKGKALEMLAGKGKLGFVYSSINGFSVQGLPGPALEALLKKSEVEYIEEVSTYQQVRCC